MAVAVSLQRSGVNAGVGKTRMSGLQVVFVVVLRRAGDLYKFIRSAERSLKQ
jgi:hypothetical protein